MDENSNRKILAQVAAEDFVGRARELEILTQQPSSESAGRGILLLAAPASGASELLRQTYDHLFNEQKTVPLYFAFRQAEKNITDCAVRFLQTFLLQTVAFRRNDPGLLNVAPDICEINDLAAPPDAHWIHQLTKICNQESQLNDTQSFVRQALSAPLRAAANTVPVIMLLDDLQNAPAELIAELKRIYAHSPISFVFSGRRRFLLNAMSGGEQKLNEPMILRLDDLQSRDAELLTEKLAKKFDVKTNDPSRDLTIRQMGAKPKFIGAILTAASEQKKDLDTFQAVEQIYTDTLFGGHLGKFYDDALSILANSRETRKQVIGLLRESLKNETGKVSAEIWRENLALNESAFDSLIDHLHIEEIVNFNSGAIYVSSENAILNDYIEAHYRLENAGESRASVVGEILKNSLKRAPQLMARVYRRSSAIRLRELLEVFNCQKVQTSLIDYEEFKNYNKETSETETALIDLPQIVYATSGAAYYPQIAQAADENRIAVASGFETADYRQENEIVWIAAEIDSKLEAPQELTEFWCDRLEAIGLICNFAKYQLWLIAPEGFSPEAIDILKQRGAYGSSRRQIELLIKELKAENVGQKKDHSEEYEMILPMGADTELIAANAVEEVAKKHHFPPKDITKIKTALVEAYINAAEHSHSPNRKIYQKLLVDDNKITITISNRGIKLSADKFAASATPIEPDEGRRGWGLKLMRTLMDEVNFEQVDDGTRISMVKYLR